MALLKKLSSFKKIEIQKLFKTAQTKVSVPGIIIKAAPKQAEIARMLAVTPKKMGNAPQRNLMRRRLKAIFYEQQLFAKSSDFLIFVSNEALAIPFATLQELMIKAAHENH